MSTNRAFDRRPRVLIIGINYSPETTGIAPYTAGMAAALAAADFEVQVLTTPPHYPAWTINEGWGKWRQDRDDQGVHIRHLRHYVPSSPTGKSRILSELSFDARAILTRKRMPDLVIAIQPALLSVHAGALIARWYRVPLGVVTQDLYTFAMSEVGLLGGKGGGLVDKVEGFGLRQAQGIAAIHERFAEAITTKFDIAPSKIRVIRNWTHIEPPTGNRAEARQRMGWHHDDIVALHAGNMGAKQGLENVIAAARLADANRPSHGRAASSHGGAARRVRFVLMGNGNRRGELAALANSVESVEFIDPVSEADFSDTLAAADVLVLNELPGIAEMCVPSKLTSYFAAGRPVVAASNAKSAAAYEVTASGAGLVVPPGDPSALLAAVLKLAEADGDALGAKGQTFARETLSEVKAHGAYVEWVTKLLNPLE